MDPVVKPLTPLMEQYLAIKQEYPDSILFFRLGDFYEMFFDDARVAAPLLEVQLTSRDKSSENPIPMCGIPHHAATNYIQKLIQKGHKVAICEQSEAAPAVKSGKTIIKREVTRVVTPALVGDPDLVSEVQSQLLLVIHPQTLSGSYEMALVNLFGGEIKFGPVASWEELRDWVLRLSPKEFLLNELDRESDWVSELQMRFPQVLVTFRTDIFGEGVLKAARCYLKETLKSDASVDFLKAQALEGSPGMVLDATALSALEILKSHSVTGEDSSLLAVLDFCFTPMGRRTLKEWLSRPLVIQEQIEERLDAVEALVQKPDVFQVLKSELTEIRDLERLTTKTALGLAMPRDVVAIRDILKRVPLLKKTLKATAVPLLCRLQAECDPLSELVASLEAALNDEAPSTLRDAGIFKSGYHAEVDALRTLSQDAKSTLAAIEARERQASGIPSLKIKFSKVFGYTFEVTSVHLKKVPAHFIRKQTIANGERFITEELKEFEEKVLMAESRLKALEESLFVELRARLAEKSSAVLNIAQILGALDCLMSFARVARERGYHRPLFHSNWNLRIVNGRHPVIETRVPSGKFVPNTVVFEEGTCRTLLVTGPNMAGKSTIMRQVALIVILAQAGSFVPASEAHLPITDAVFTRIGSSDDLARGQSTFMVEMCEISKVLQKASSSSLLVIDEIGRGTSTYDGLSLAWSILEHIHTRVRAKTLFATHFHELTALESEHPNLKNATVLVQKNGQDIVFLHQLAFGSSNKSFGIEVARLAGLPVPVLSRAREILENFDRSKVLERSSQKSIQNYEKKSLESRSLIES